ncbi:hypothetical protein CDAR_111141 [Caerostris darwini]|uniref:Uncharacterized protein n=1 Tax=Caerostris darwini TaxID=1538125 RepID=A0AAV4SRA1_9ARAC|nr:hypothetical protein CDAR_111141 [Caerostris darwini]
MSFLIEKDQFPSFQRSETSWLPERVPLEKDRKTCHHGTLIPTDATEFTHSGTLISFLLHHVPKRKENQSRGYTFRLGAVGFCSVKVQLLRIREEF